MDNIGVSMNIGGSMKSLLVSIVFLFSMISWAQMSAPVYFVGEQKVSKSVSEECFLELQYSADETQVQLRGILTNSHEGKYVTVGSLQANYMFVAGSIQKNAYYFQDKTPKAPVKQLVLIAENPQAPSSLSAAIFHDGHHDPIACENLNVAEGDELNEAIEFFAEFETISNEAPGEHNHSH
jgi:hypothetical protein